ncbi:hypothetical protein GGR56DRAFT_643437 [Xylariaceae sp. FL0804]|nr:hypothetical protein GGR56DRAFT_643437 [Xylariaceae sp. FL0804]
MLAQAILGPRWPRRSLAALLGRAVMISVAWTPILPSICHGGKGLSGSPGWPGLMRFDTCRIECSTWSWGDSDTGTEYGTSDLVVTAAAVPSFGSALSVADYRKIVSDEIGLFVREYYLPVAVRGR